MTKEERSRLETLDTALRSESVRENIRSIVVRVREQLARRTDALMSWEPFPLNVLDLDRSGISSRERCDVGDQLLFIEKASFLIGEHAIVGEMFFPRRLIAGYQGIVQLLSASDQFVLRNGNVCGGNDACSGQKTNERELHKKG